MEEQLQVEQVQSSEQDGQETTLEENKMVYNTKPRFLARILSPIVDIFLLFLLFFGAFQLETSTPISNDYHRVREELITISDTTKLETNYGYKLYDDDEKYNAFVAQSYQTYKVEDTEDPYYNHSYVVVNNSEISKEVNTAYQDSLKNNSTYQARYLTYKATRYGLTMLAAGSSELVLFLLIPLMNKRRATLGRFVAITSLINVKEVKAKWWQVLVRFLFILVVETALPLYFLTELGALLVVIIVNLIVTLISRKTSRTLRDYVSFTKIINKNSFKPINEQ